MTQKSRRDFIRASSLLVAGGAVTGPLGIARSAHAFGSDVIRVGLIGCGKCGREAAVRALATAGPVQLVAMADVFGDRIQSTFRQLKSRYSDRLDVPRERRFVGLGGYRQLLSADVDLVILATPPGFRPLHFEAAVAAGKHVFLEKPVAVDATGVRRVLQAGAVAKQLDLTVAAGLYHRHEPAYQETISKLQEGIVGPPVSLRVYRNGGSMRPRPRQAKESELAYQLRNWYCFRWLGGDSVVERHIHNLDIGNWLLGRFPISVNAHGGRSPDGHGCGDTFDQFFNEFTYAGGQRMFSQCRHVKGCWNNVSEHVDMARGRADISGAKIYDQSGARIWQSKLPRGGQQQQMQNLFAALRAGTVSNETDYAAKSTLTAIMARMAAYTGQQVSWEQAFSATDSLGSVDTLLSLDENAPVIPDANGRYPFPVPGQA